MMKIPIVDDSKAMRMIIKRTLREAGFGEHPTVEAADGTEGLAALSPEHGHGHVRDENRGRGAWDPVC